METIRCSIFLRFTGFSGCARTVGGRGTTRRENAATPASWTRFHGFRGREMLFLCRQRCRIKSSRLSRAGIFTAPAVLVRLPISTSRPVTHSKLTNRFFAFATSQTTHNKGSKRNTPAQSAFSTCITIRVRVLNKCATPIERARFYCRRRSDFQGIHCRQTGMCRVEPSRRLISDRRRRRRR